MPRYICPGTLSKVSVCACVRARVGERVRMCALDGVTKNKAGKQMSIVISPVVVQGNREKRKDCDSAGTSGLQEDQNHNGADQIRQNLKPLALITAEIQD